MQQEIANADMIILAVTEPAYDNWMVWGNVQRILNTGSLRDRVERDYQTALTGRWPYKKPIYRVIAKRKGIA